MRVQSLIGDEGVKNSIYKNFKQVVEDNLRQTDYESEQGFFPLVSRYRKNNERHKITELPKNESVDDIRRTNWIISTVDDLLPLPHWEVHIPKEEFGDFIKEDTNNKAYPVNVYLNYHYLNTSTEYHQHFFGFEENIETDDKSLNVFDSTNIDTINNKFGKSDYRLINWGNKLDNRKKLNHNFALPIDLNLAY